MNKHVYLNYIGDLCDSIRGPNPLIQVLLGPRQVGKTTSTLKLNSEEFVDVSHYVSADKVFNSNETWLRDEARFSIQSKKFSLLMKFKRYTTGLKW